MKASLGIHNVYPEKAVLSQTRGESKSSVYTGKGKKDFRKFALNEVIIATGTSLGNNILPVFEKSPKTNTLLKSQHESSNRYKERTGVSPHSTQSNIASPKSNKMKTQHNKDLQDL